MKKTGRPWRAIRGSGLCILGFSAIFRLEYQEAPVRRRHAPRRGQERTGRLVSVIMTARDEESEIEEAFARGCKTITRISTDNRRRSSTDRTGEIADGLAARDARLNRPHRRASGGLVGKVYAMSRG